ncbi:hypothetical protein GCM10010220_02770 [Streptomyces parvulus]|nr:hypothetical protein GCM10010220_02770 [Streptomyces parvulus]
MRGPYGTFLDTARIKGVPQRWYGAGNRKNEPGPVTVGAAGRGTGKWRRKREEKQRNASGGPHPKVRAPTAK